MNAGRMRMSDQNSEAIKAIVTSRYRFAYLGGSIFHNQDPLSWRARVSTLLPEGWKSINPLEFENNDYIPAQLVELDYCLIRNSSAIIADISQPSWGTAMEFAYARRIGVPVFGFSSLFTKFDNRETLRAMRDPAMKMHWVPPWCAAHLDKFFPSVELACAELANVVV